MVKKAHILLYSNTNDYIGMVSPRGRYRMTRSYGCGLATWKASDNHIRWKWYRHMAGIGRPDPKAVVSLCGGKWMARSIGCGLTT
jgi:hypothetical protein